MLENFHSKASLTNTAYTVYETLCPKDVIWKGKSNLRRGKIKGR
jgi:hypothetical protein